jgi:hypothetical protein
MALTNTLLQNLRKQSNLDKYENRGSRYGALDLFMKETDNPTGIVSPSLKEAAISAIDRTLQVPVIDYESGITIGSTLPAVISDSENVSQLVTVSFTTYSFGFTQVPTLFKNNEIDMQRDFNSKMGKYINKLGSTLDTAAVAALEAAKTQVATDNLGHTFASNILTSTLANEEVIIGDLGAVMNSNDYYDNLHVVGNTGIQAIIGHLAQHSGNQAIFKEMQFMDKELHFTNRISNAASRKATGYCVNANSVGMIHGFEHEALAGTISRTGHEWGIDTLPGLDLPIGTYYYESVGDFSGIVGSGFTKATRVQKRHFGFAVLIAFVTAYNSATSTIASPILKFNVATT